MKAIYFVALRVAAVALLVTSVPVHASKLVNDTNGVKCVKNYLTIE